MKLSWLSISSVFKEVPGAALHWAPVAPERFQPTLRPEIGRGVFETLLVAAGRAVELDAHLERIATAVRALYDEPPPAGLGTEIRDAARGHDLARLRATVSRRVGEALGADIAIDPVDPADVLPAWERAIDLAPYALPGGLGPYKWADRRHLDRAAAGLGPRELLLITDEHGAVLETARANVFAVNAGVLLTPPLDRRLLPGIARARAIEVARATGFEVRETALSVPDLYEAGEVLLTGSVRGIEPVRSIDGAPLHPPGEVAAAIAAALRERWLGGRALAAST